MRYDDSPELFGCGIGTSTCGDIECDMCGTLYNQGNDEAEDYDGDSVLHTTFAGLQVCECCFARVENEVLYRMPYILPWYKKILTAKNARLARAVEEFQDLEKS